MDLGLSPARAGLTSAELRSSLAVDRPQAPSLAKPSPQPPSTPSRGRCAPQPQPLLHRLPHQELLRLAGDGQREGLDEFDVARDFVVGDLSLAEAAHFLGRQGLPGADADPGAELFAVAVVGDAEHLDVLDLRVLVEIVLDLAGIEVLAAADHHVLDAPDDVAVALGVDGGEVAGVHPARGFERPADLLSLA